MSNNEHANKKNVEEEIEIADELSPIYLKILFNYI